MGPEDSIYGYLTLWSEAKNMTSSKRVRTYYHIEGNVLLDEEALAKTLTGGPIRGAR